jgi:hypothetical protein
MDVSDTSRPLADMLVFEPDATPQFFVLDKITGKQ